jgi:hypothetical protein
LKNDRNETTEVASAHPDLIKKFDAILKKEHSDPGVEQWQFVERVIRMQ